MIGYNPNDEKDCEFYNNGKCTHPLYLTNDKQCIDFYCDVYSFDKERRDMEATCICGTKLKGTLILLKDDKGRRIGEAAYYNCFRCYRKWAVAYNAIKDSRT